MTPQQRHEIEELVNVLPPITLAEMSAVRLMKRTDCKYLTNLPTLMRLLELTRNSYFIQEHEGTRISPYATTYWDDANYTFYHTHQAGHRPRVKIRVRTYVCSQCSFLEIKTKDNHGKTRKQRVQVPSVEAVVNNHVGNDFLQQHLGLSLDKIAPTVSNRFERITLVNRNKTERLTIDFDIRFINCETHAEQLMENIVIIELKREGHAASPILPILRKLRIKPAGFSKYCVGATVTTPNLRVNRFKKRLISIHKVALC